MDVDEIAPSGLLAAEGLSLALGAAPFDASFSPGEIVGLAGLEGQGQEAFLEALCGLRHPAAGRISVDAGGERVLISSFRQAVRRGVAYLARDRRANGIFPSLSILGQFWPRLDGPRSAPRLHRPATTARPLRDLPAAPDHRRAFA